ncbi:hypothetical protein N7532_012009 [Penicillium argentinense]|uniref:RanBD1 domain-containing protein n=1 Tax=Penicillium argentinense TaxID=1131581 RepID=A0A9W9JVJ7_9EURO|nr:uncharacterized protein N7532_012009 [Penicillium argentinense]KAJ5082966.1 hypothetical protein N7532_012009 [Penicillium argentinense]
MSSSSGFYNPAPPSRLPSPAIFKRTRFPASIADNPRIKDIRRRPRGVTPTSGSNTDQPANAFGGLTSASSFSAPTPAFQSTGFNFGQSQSFPGAGAGIGSNQPNQSSSSGSAPFSFGGGAQPSFNFGGSSSFAPVNNPFANTSANPAPAAPASKGTSFTGFGANNQTTSQTASPIFSFGAPQSANASTGSSLFGQSNNTPAVSTAADSMQMSPDTKPKAPSTTPSSSFQSRNLFGDSTPNIFSPKPATPAGNPFSNMKTTSATPQSMGPPQGSATPRQPPPQPAGTPKDQAPTQNLFAPKPATDQANGKPADANPFKNLFGAASATPQPAGTSNDQAPTQNLFAPKPATDQTSDKPATATAVPSKPLFGETSETSATPKAADPSQGSATPAQSIFAAKPAANQADDKPADANPFKNLFGTPSATPKPTETSKEKAPTQNIFAPKPAADQADDKPADANPFKNMFTQKPATDQAPQGSATPIKNPFAPKPATDQASDKSTSATPTKPLFGTTSATPQVTGLSQGSVTPAQSIFAAKPAANQADDKPADANPFKNLFGAPSATSKPSEPSKEQAPTQSLFAPKPASDQALSKTNMFAQKPATEQPSGKPAGLQTPGASFGSSATPNSNLPANVGKTSPAAANKVRALDTIFKQRVAECKPDADGLDKVIIFYIGLRRQMGVPVGTKESWKNVGLAPIENKSVDPEPATANGPNDSATSSVFAKSFSSPANGTPRAGDVSTHAKKDPAPTSAGNMFANPKFTQSQSSTPSLSVPKFGNGSAGVDFMAQFKKKAEETAAKEKAKRKAEEFDSDEDDEAEWERKDAEKQREKREKLESQSKKKAVFIPGKGFQMVDADDESTGAAFSDSAKPALPAPSPAPSSAGTPWDSVFNSPNPITPVPDSQNIFRRSPKRSAPDDDNDDKADSEASGHESKKSKSMDNTETKSSLDTPIPPPTAAAGRSLFDRIQSPASGGTPVSSGTPAFTDTPAPASPASEVTNSNVSNVGCNADDETAPGAVYDLSTANAGEENENVEFECRARAFKLTTGWTSQGMGSMRLLKNPETGRARIVLRADPGGNVIINTLLKKELGWTVTGGSIQFLVPESEAGARPAQWALRVKKDNLDDLVKRIEENKY